MLLRLKPAQWVRLWVEPNFLWKLNWTQYNWKGMMLKDNFNILDLFIVRLCFVRWKKLNKKKKWSNFYLLNFPGMLPNFSKVIFHCVSELCQSTNLTAVCIFGSFVFFMSQYLFRESFLNYKRLFLANENVSLFSKNSQ